MKIFGPSGVKVKSSGPGATSSPRTGSPGRVTGDRNFISVFIDSIVGRKKR